MALDAAFREVNEVMPQAYALLPSPEFGEKVDSTLIEFGASLANGSDVVRQLLASYVTGISSKDHDRLIQFLTATLDQRPEPWVDSDLSSGGNDCLDLEVFDTRMPNRLRAGRLSEAVALHQELDKWQAPPGVDVVQIAGTGLVTPAGIRYKYLPIANQYGGLQHEIITTPVGNGSVVAQSAVGEFRKASCRVDLHNYNRCTDKRRWPFVLSGHFDSVVTRGASVWWACVQVRR